MTIELFKETFTYAEVLSRASAFLKKSQRDPQIAEWLMKERFALSLTDLVRLRNQVMDEKDKGQFNRDIIEAGKGRPPQHIVGHEWFYDRKFIISESTLIPRPETEEWFERYISALPREPLRVIDLGTGSGVLAISHKLERPQDEVIAVDISQEVLTVARSNAESLGADVLFIKSDMLDEVSGTFDLIISNPPYISQSERNVMDESVIAFEPHLALFAEDDGLYFYKSIAEKSVDKLKPGGQIILEFGYRQARKIVDIFKQYYPKAQITIEKDFNMNDRTLHLKNQGEKREEGDVNADGLS